MTDQQTEQQRELPTWPEETELGPIFSFPRKTILNRSGEEVRMLLLLRSGLVRLTVPRNAQEVFVSVRTAGWLLGAVPAILGTRHLTTAVTMTDCEIRTLSLKDFHRLRRHDLSVGPWLQVMLARELAEQLPRGAALTGADCRSRVEQVMVDMFCARGRRTAKSIAAIDP